MPTAGDIIADYTVVRRLGRGGSADVFLAEGADSVPVALKVLRPDGTDLARARARLDREFEFASQVRDPRVVAARAAGATWVALEFVDGAAATGLVARGAERDLPGVLRVLAEVAAALDHCHRLGILHRDVKPGNILVTGEGTGAAGHLTDFGAAQYLVPPATVLDHGQVDASLPYAAPELLRAGDLSPQTDGYAYAATAYELLAGRPPFPRATPTATVHAQLHARPPGPEKLRSWLPASLTSVFGKALAKRAEDRYATCSELAEILRRTLRGLVPPHSQR